MWEKYGKWILGGIGLCLVVAGLVQYRLQVQKTRTIAASSLYDTVIMNNQLEAAKEILANYSNTTYASLAALALAKSSVEQNNGAEAQKYLQIAIEKAQFDDVKWIAVERLARVLAEQKKFTEAETLLENTKIKSSYVPLFEEVKGDLYLMQNEREKARLAYQKALRAIPEGIPTTRLQLKYTDVGGLLEGNAHAL